MACILGVGLSEAGGMSRARSADQGNSSGERTEIDYWMVYNVVWIWEIEMSESKLLKKWR